MNILQSIFTDYYEHIIYKLHPRPSVIGLFICPVSLFLVFIAIVKWNPHIHWSIFS